MNLILERTERVRFYTDMRLVFEATGLRASDFDWYISDIETNCGSDEFSDTDRWLSGIELESFLATRTVQFIWAVFSAFPIGYRRNVEQAPYVDDNPCIGRVSRCHRSWMMRCLRLSVGIAVQHS